MFRCGSHIILRIIINRDSQNCNTKHHNQQQHKMCNDSPLKVLIEQVGGESQFSFLTEVYCESIQEDSDLQMVFKSIDSERLVELFTNLLNIGFAHTAP